MVSFAPLAAPARLKRPALALVAIGALVVGAAAMRASISAEDARAAAQDALSAMAGRPLRIEGTPTTRLLPWPRVRFAPARIVASGDEVPIAETARLDASLDVAALLLGRIRPDEIRLVEPTARIDVAGAGSSLFALARRFGEWRPTTVTIERGRVVFVAGTAEETIEGLDARLAWPRPSANVDLRSAFRWHGEAVTFAVETPSAGLLAAGTPGRLDLRFVSESARAVLSGDTALFGAPLFEGRADLELVDAARFARWSGLPRHRDLLAGHLRATGRLTVDDRGGTLSDGRFDLAGNRAEGAVSWRRDLAHPRLAGTLAFADVDLTSEENRPFGAGWGDIPLDRAGLGWDFDLRLSAPRVRLPALTLDRVATSLLVADGRLNAEIGTADVFGKPISFVVRGAVEASGLRAQLRATADDLPLADVATLFGVDGVEAGRLGVSLDAESRCRTLRNCPSGTEGTVRVRARAAAVTGNSPFADVSRFHPIVPKPSGPRVTTTWDEADAVLRFAATDVTVDRLAARSKAARFLFSGKSDLATGAVSLLGTAYFPAFRPDPARPADAETAVPLRLGGTLGRLDVTIPDAAPSSTPAAAPPPPGPAAPIVPPLAPPIR